MLTERQTAVCTFLRRYFYARTLQIRDAVVPTDKDGSGTRECLRSLRAHGFIRSHEPRLIEQGKTTAPPIHVLTLKGSCVLAAETGDCSLLLTVEPTFKDFMSLHHYCALTTLHAAVIDPAMNAQAYVKQHALYFEHEVIQPDADDPSKKFRLYTKLAGNVVCVPDSAFETEIAGGYRRAWYVEREMGSDTPGRVAAKKHKGYHQLLAAQAFKRHFPQAGDFRVLAVCPNAGWRDALRREIKGKPGAELWLFAAAPEVTAESFLHGPVFYTWDRGPLPFVPKPAASSALVHAGGGRGG